MALEIELKARVADLPGLRAALPGLGARLLAARAHEDNILLDDAGGGLQKRGEALRVRLVGGRAILTWKGLPPPGSAAGASAGLKVREEIETEATDAASLMVVLERLGFKRAFRYERYRETWELGPVHVMLDETPAGDYLEVEGEADDVRAAERRLGVKPEDVVADSYPALFRKILLDRKDTSAEMVFPSATGASGHE